MADIDDYLCTAAKALASVPRRSVTRLAQAVLETWAEHRQVFLCGNGGSAANAIHLCNDLIFGVSPKGRDGIRAIALCDNPSVMTCLSNDVGYDEVFAYQLAVQSRPGDLLIVMSGSGNSPNILAALRQAKESRVRSAAILGFDGGKARQQADIVVHVPIDDMQAAEDCQQCIGHAMTKWLKAHAPVGESALAGQLS
jgi:D-sedoheptulose 7-phosphate isomerase